MPTHLHEMETTETTRVLTTTTLAQKVTMPPEKACQKDPSLPPLPQELKSQSRGVTQTKAHHCSQPQSCDSEILLGSRGGKNRLEHGELQTSSQRK